MMLLRGRCVGYSFDRSIDPMSPGCAFTAPAESTVYSTRAAGARVSINSEPPIEFRRQQACLRIAQPAPASS